jgi:hypothetical protein
VVVWAQALKYSEPDQVFLHSSLTLKQLFRFGDRKGVKYLLAPTHEEEITTLVASTVKSYKDLPVRLFQICMSDYYVRVMMLTLVQPGSIVMNYDQDTDSSAPENLL